MLQDRKIAIVLLATTVTTMAAWAYAQQRPNQQGSSEEFTVGRYTVVASNRATVLLDTATGRTWSLGDHNEWIPIKRGDAGIQTEYGGSRPNAVWSRVSPFTEVQFQEKGRVVVQFEEKYYELISINDLPTRQILDSCRKQFGADEVEKRFTEDITEVLAGMGHKPSGTVKLVLKDPKTGEARTVAKAPMTHDNRRKAYAARNRKR